MYAYTHVYVPVSHTFLGLSAISQYSFYVILGCSRAYLDDCRCACLFLICSSHAPRASYSFPLSNPVPSQELNTCS